MRRLSVIAREILAPFFRNHGSFIIRTGHSPNRINLFPQQNGDELNFRS